MASLEETQAEIRIKLAELAELAELFTSKVKVNFLAVHESNPNAHMLIGASSLEEIESAIAALKAKEDAEDLAVVAERRGESTIPHEKLVTQLKKEGLLE